MSEERGQLVARLNDLLIRTQTAESTEEPYCALAAAAAPASGGDEAGVAALHREQLATVGATANVVARVDALQGELGEGPGLAAAREGRRFRSDDLASDRRWPRFGREAAQVHGFRSMLSVPLPTAASRSTTVINCYSTRVQAFGPDAESAADVLALYGAMAISAVTARMKERNMAVALESNRDIGAATGILMHRYRLTRDEAFMALRAASQDTHRKLRDVASDVLLIGDLDPYPARLPLRPASACPGPLPVRPAATARAAR